ncbi:MAG: hypothetical protein V4438_01405 [Patescibacteria group bacterium]
MKTTLAVFTAFMMSLVLTANGQQRMPYTTQHQQVVVEMDVETAASKIDRQAELAEQHHDTMRHAAFNEAARYLRGEVTSLTPQCISTLDMAYRKSCAEGHADDTGAAWMVVLKRCGHEVTVQSGRTQVHQEQYQYGGEASTLRTHTAHGVSEFSEYETSGHSVDICCHVLHSGSVCNHSKAQHVEFMGKFYCPEDTCALCSLRICQHYADETGFRCHLDYSADEVAVNMAAVRPVPPCEPFVQPPPRMVPKSKVFIQPEPPPASSGKEVRPVLPLRSEKAPIPVQPRSGKEPRDNIQPPRNMPRDGGAGTEVKPVQPRKIVLPSEPLFEA